MGPRGEASVGGLGDKVPQKLDHFFNFIYIILMLRDSRCDKNCMNKIVQIFNRLENLENNRDCFTHITFMQFVTPDNLQPTGN